jgi:hypothetical protein
MDTQSHVETTRLHCEHLRTLIDQVIGELRMLGLVLTTTGHPSSAIIAMELSTVEKQSNYIVAETLRLQRFVQSLKLESTNASEAAVGQWAPSGVF